MSWNRVYDTFFDLQVIRHSLPSLLEDGLPNTLLITAMAASIALVIGMVVGVSLLSQSRLIRAPGRAYVSIFRGLPQIVTVYTIGAGLPLAGLTIFGQNSLLYAGLAVGIAEGAYVTEILRSGFQNVAVGLVEATRSLGVGRSRTTLSVVVPLGVRNVLPALTGQIIIVLKITSLVYLLGLSVDQRDLFAVAQDQANLGLSLAPLTAAGLVYLALTLPLTYVVNTWERRLRERQSVSGRAQAPRRMRRTAVATATAVTAGGGSGSTARLGDDLNSQRTKTAALVSSGASVTVADRAPAGVDAGASPGSGEAKNHAAIDVHYVGVSKSLSGNRILDNVDLKITGGQTTCLIGPSGAGKSTLLRCTNLLTRPDEGEVRIGGKNICDPRTDLDQLRASVGIVFQRFNLLPHFTVLRNVSFSLHHVRGLGWDEADVRARERLDEVGLLDLASRYPSSLSGGQQQRVAIARALAMDPQLMLFDEATSSLDPELVKDVLALMRDLSGRGMTMIVVTHELRYARDVAHQIAFLDEGRIVESGSPDAIFGNPTSPRLQRFLGEML